MRTTNRFRGACRSLHYQLALVLAGSSGKGTELNLGRQDAHGCTLMHYACGLRNAPALQLLLNSSVDPHVIDVHGQSAAHWAKRFGFEEGEALISQAVGAPVESTPPHQTLPPPVHSSISSLNAETSGSLTLVGNAASVGDVVGVSASATQQVLSNAPLPAGESSTSLASFPSPPTHGGGATRSLQQFLDPQAPAPEIIPSTNAVISHGAIACHYAGDCGDAIASSPSIGGSVTESCSLAGFLTAAAAHVDDGLPPP